MAEIHIHRAHGLGLSRAREIAGRWAEQVEAEFGMDCTVEAGEASDTVSFRRSGASGTLTVAADHFELQASLGFLLGAFARTIEAEITKNLDTLLNAAPVKSKPTARKAAARKPPG
jgi:putative polyhydroxyalkanoate system protein